MSTGTTEPTHEQSQPAREVDEALGSLIDTVGALSDVDLHRAHRDGGWTVAQVISHINVCTIVWAGDIHRLAHDPELTFFFREEIGHDLTGYPPPSVDIAVRQLQSTRRTLATTLDQVPEEIRQRTVEIPDLGTMKVEEWIPLIAGHLVMHTGQATEILTDRDAMPAGV